MNLKKTNNKCLIITLIILISMFMIIKPSSAKRWLSKNSTDINLDNSDYFLEDNILKEDLDKYNIFLLGELHGVAVTPKINSKFLKYFVKNAKVKYYLMETSPCEAYVLNQYIQTGNIKFLDEFMNNIVGSFSWSKESYNEWKNIYKLNNSLPLKDKITILGIDINDSPETYYHYLTSIMNKHGIPAELLEDVKQFNSIEKNLDTSSYEKLLSLVNIYIDNINKKNDMYSKFLAEDFLEYKYILNNFCYCLKFLNMNRLSDKFFKYREKKMYSNFKCLNDMLPKGKYYGFFGNDHVLQKGYNLAALINKDSLQSKVLSIQSRYDNSYSSMFYDENYERLSLPNLNEKFTTLINKISTSNSMLFKISGNKSPFNTTKDYIYFQLDSKDEEENKIFLKSTI